MVIYPHKDLRWVLGILLFAAVIITLALCFGCFSASVKTFVIVFLILTVAVLVDTLSLTKIAITLKENNISLKNTLTKYSIAIHWNELHYGYYMYSSKGHKFLLLSTKALTPSMQKKYFRKSTMIMAQFLNRNDNKEYLCFSVANNLNNQILPFIPSHIIIQGESLHKPNH